MTHFPSYAAGAAKVPIVPRHLTQGLSASFPVPSLPERCAVDETGVAPPGAGRAYWFRHRSAEMGPFCDTLIMNYLVSACAMKPVAVTSVEVRSEAENCLLEAA